MIVAFLGMASFFDVKSRKIPDKLTLAFFLLRLIVIPLVPISLNNVYGLLAGLFIILIPAMIVNKPMGGDIKTMAVLGFYLGFYGIAVTVFIIVALALIYYGICKLRKMKLEEIPFALFFFCGFILTLGITQYFI